MRLLQSLLSAAALGLLASASPAQSGSDLPWHGKDGPLLRADGSPWRPELQLELVFPALAQPAPFRAQLPIDGEWVEVDLRPYSLRSADFRLLVIDGSGVPREVEAPPARTYRGELVGRPDTEVRANLDELGRLSAVVETPAGRWTVEPLSRYVPDASPLAHALYSHANRAASRGECGVHDPVRPSGSSPPEGDQEDSSTSPPSGSGAGGASHEHAHSAGDEPLEAKMLSYRAGGLACHVDNQYYQWAGNSIPNAVANIEQLLGEVSAKYDDNGVGPFRFNFVGAVFETGPGNVHPSTDAEDLLSEFTLDWLTSGYYGFDYGTKADFYHLFTGRDLDGGTLGLAYVDDVCDTNGAFGLSETTFTSDLSDRGWLTTHEFGHNLGSEHDGDCNGLFDDKCQVMCPNLNASACSSTGISWSSQARDAVNAGIALSCFDPATGTIYADIATSHPFPDGTAMLPFQTLATGLANTQSGWTLVLGDGTYDESVLTLNQPMKLDATGGIARIE